MEEENVGLLALEYIQRSGLVIQKIQDLLRDEIFSHTSKYDDYILNKIGNDEFLAEMRTKFRLIKYTLEELESELRIDYD